MLPYQEMSPLHYAVDRGNYDITNELLTRGALINAKDNCGQTALMLAAICDHTVATNYFFNSISSTIKISPWNPNIGYCKTFN
jgi:ankyrin repeat protein